MSNFNHLTDHLLNFVDDLRVAGYNIGLEQFITVQNLILALTAQGRLPAKLADLQTFLAPVLCHSPKEQEDFAQHFTDWARRVETITEEVQPQPVLTLETELKSISRGMTFWKWTWRLVLVLMLILVAMELFKLNQDSSGTKSPPVIELTDKPTLPVPKSVEPSASSGTLVPPTPPPPTTLSQDIWESKWSIGLTLSFPLLLFLTWWLWWQYQVHRFLARKTVSTQPDLQQFLVQGHQHQLFSSVPLQRVAQGLRKHFTLPTSHLEVMATLEKTIQAGGWFTPVTGTVKTSPEYLVLIDRTTFRDHQAEFINTLVKRLESEEVFITRYYFDADPRRCYPEQPQLPPLTLPELAGRYPQHRLLIFTDGQGFIHPITGELAGWLTQLSDWSQRTLFTLEAQPQWGYREKLLEDEAGFLVLPANESGLTVLVEYINEQRKADLASSPEAPFPEMLIDRPRRYLERHAPEAETVTELLAQVRQFLGETGYDWFSACAVYPELRWQLTLYLGEALQVLNEERLAKLARLPWFRYGYMPNWLREKLVKDLSLAQERQIREALQVLLLTAVEGGKGEFRLEVARGPQKSLAALWQRVLSAVVRREGSKGVWRDYVFLTFMEDRLAVKVPKMFKGLINNYTVRKKGFFSLPVEYRRLLALTVDWLLLLSIVVITLITFDSMGTDYLLATVFVCQFFYKTIMESSPLQATLGKRLTGIKVTDLNRSKISFAKALTRNLGKLLFGVIIAIILSMIVVTTPIIVGIIIDGMARRITWLLSENVLTVIIIVVAVLSGMVDAIAMDLHNRLSGCMVVMKANLHNQTHGQVAEKKKRWKLALFIASFVVIFILFNVSLFISVSLVKRAIDRPQTSSSTGCEIVGANGPLHSFFIKRNGEELEIKFYSELQVGDEIHIRKPTTVEKELIDKYYGGKQWLELALSNGKVITLEYKDTPYTCLSFPWFRKVSSYTNSLEEVIRVLFFPVVTTIQAITKK